MCILPKLPSLPAGVLPVLRTRAAIAAENDARIAAARAVAHVVDAAEQVARERTAKQGLRAERREPMPAAAPRPATVLRAKLLTLSGDEVPFAAEDDLSAIVAVLRENAYLASAELTEGVCLSLWRDGRVATRRFYVHAAAAQAAGEAALAEGKADRATVATALRRSEIIAGESLPRDQVTPSRKRPACRDKGSVYGRNVGWNMAVRECRAVFSHG